MADLPVFANERKHDYFNVDEEIYVWLVFRKEDRESEWFNGNVRKGYRHHDGCVSYRLFDVGPQDINTYPATSLLDAGGFWGCGFHSPIIMKRFTFDFFKRNPHLYGKWCRGSYDRIDAEFAIVPGTESYLAKDLLENY